MKEDETIEGLENLPNKHVEAFKNEENCASSKNVTFARANTSSSEIGKLKKNYFSLPLLLF